MIPANNNALPSGNGQGAKSGEVGNLNANTATHCPVIDRGLHAYEREKARLQLLALTPDDYLQRCKRAAMAAGI